MSNKVLTLIIENRKKNLIKNGNFIENLIESNF